MEEATSEKAPKEGVCLMCSTNSKASSVADVELRGWMKREDC